MALLLNILLTQMSYARCLQCDAYHGCGPSSTGGELDFCGNTNLGSSCTLPEVFCATGTYCGFAQYYYGCFTCPSYFPNCNSLVSSLRSLTNTPMTKDPVDIFTGEVYFSSTDFSLSGRGPKLSLNRKFRSFSTNIGLFGYGWRTDFDINLTQDSSGDVTIYDADGAQIYFTNISGTYINSPGNFFTLTHE